MFSGAISKVLVIIRGCVMVNKLPKGKEHNCDMTLF